MTRCSTVQPDLLRISAGWKECRSCTISLRINVWYTTSLKQQYSSDVADEVGLHGIERHLSSPPVLVREAMSDLQTVAYYTADA